MDSMTKKQLFKIYDEKNIKYSKSWKKDKLIKPK